MISESAKEKIDAFRIDSELSDSDWIFQELTSTIKALVAVVEVMVLLLQEFAECEPEWA
jgi:hypothetical protein